MISDVSSAFVLLMFLLWTLRKPVKSQQTCRAVLIRFSRLFHCKKVDCGYLSFLKSRLSTKLGLHICDHGEVWNIVAVLLLVHGIRAGASHIDCVYMLKSAQASSVTSMDYVTERQGFLSSKGRNSSLRGRMFENPLLTARLVEASSFYKAPESFPRIQWLAAMSGSSRASI